MGSGPIQSVIQKALGGLGEYLTEDLKLKTFNGLKIRIGSCKVTVPEIRITSDNFKVKVIDKAQGSDGKAIIDKPIDIDIKIQEQEIILMPAQIIKYQPKIDIMLGGKK